MNFESPPSQKQGRLRRAGRVVLSALDRIDQASKQDGLGERGLKRKGYIIPTPYYVDVAETHNLSALAPHTISEDLLKDNTSGTTDS